MRPRINSNMIASSKNYKQSRARYLSNLAKTHQKVIAEITITAKVYTTKCFGKTIYLTKEEAMANPYLNIQIL